MAVRIESDGYFEVAYQGPWTGLHVQAPENLIPDTAFPTISNFLLRNAEIRSFPQILSGHTRQFLPSPDGNPVLGIGSFLSKNFVWHTFCFTVNGLFQLKPGSAALVANGQNPWIPLGGPQLAPNLPVAWTAFQNILYYTNSNGHVSAWDGAAINPIADVAATGTTFPIPNNFTGSTFSSEFMAELDSHIILANTTEIPYTAGVASAAVSFPQRIRWSNSGFNPTSAAGVFGANLGTVGATFDPTVSVNAGSNDFLDVPDQITGLMFIGRVGYIFRSNGITEVAPTGRGLAPFDFNHLWASQQGIGSVLPFGIAQYGSNGIFVSTEQIYQMTIGGAQPIGAGARDAIFSDIANTNGVPVAWISPMYRSGFIYLAYHLAIPFPGAQTKMYIYAIEEGNWTSCLLDVSITSVPATCWTGDPVISAQPSVIIPSQAGSSGGGTGGGGTGGGSGGGFFNGCFTGNVRVKTSKGFLKFEDMPSVVEVLNETGFHFADLQVHEGKYRMVHIGDGRMVTTDHLIKHEGSWLPAGDVFQGKRVQFTGRVYNLHVRSDNPDDQHYVLDDGIVAHNLKKIGY